MANAEEVNLEMSNSEVIVLTMYTGERVIKGGIIGLHQQTKIPMATEAIFGVEIN